MLARGQDIKYGGGEGVGGEVPHRRIGHLSRFLLDPVLLPGGFCPGWH